MGKRPNNGGQGNKPAKKKFKVSSGFLDPGTSGIYASCARRKEQQATQELGLLIEEKVEEYYKEELEKIKEEAAAAEAVAATAEGEDPKEEVEEEELSIEDQLKKEIADLKKKDKPKSKEERKKELLQFIDLNCECVIFCKTRKPIIPEEFVQRLMDELADPNNKTKRTRYVQKLTPITNSCSASAEQLDILIKQVLAPHFHNKDGQRDYKFAVEVNRRNFNTIPKMDIINNIVAYVCHGDDYNHKVDLKNYDKLILVECFKNNIGISVVGGEYVKKYKKYNIQKIFEDKFKEEDATTKETVKTETEIESKKE